MEQEVQSSPLGSAKSSGIVGLLKALQAPQQSAPVEAPNTHVVHEPSPEEQEALAMRREMHQASMTKFSTGEPQLDLQNYRTIKTMAKQLMGLLNEGR